MNDQAKLEADAPVVVDAEEALPDDHASDDEAITDQIDGLVADIQLLIDTEIAYYRSKLDVNVAETKRVFALFGLGLGIGTAGLTALILGILLTLAQYVGAGPATLIVVSVSFVAAAVLIWLAVRRARQLPVDSEKL